MQNRLRPRFLFAILLLCFLASCDFIDAMMLQAKFGSTLNVTKDSIYTDEKKPPYFPAEYNETSRLYYLCKVWGFTKYYYQEPGFDTELVKNVDSILLDAIPKVQKPVSKEEFNNILLGVITAIQPSVGGGKTPYPNIKDYALIDNQWMDDSLNLSQDIKNRLEEIFFAHTGTKQHYVYNRGNEGTVRQLAEQTYDKFDTEGVRLLGLFRYWNMINYFYPYKNLMDKHWDEVLMDAILRFQEAKDNKEYRWEIYRLTNSLQDSHTSYPSSLDGAIMGPYRPNFLVKRIGNTMIITEMRFDKIKEGFYPGDIILKIDGVDALNRYDSFKPITGGGNYWSEQRFLCNATVASHDSISVYTLLRGNDTLTLRSNNRKAWDWNRQKRKRERENEKNQQYKFINDSVAYLNLRSTTGDNFRKNFDPIRHASAIILDLRCYPDANLGLKLSENFVPPTPFFAYVTYADTRFPGMLRYHRSSREVGSEKHYKGRVMVLVNELTESYSEYLTMMLQANPNTVVVGSASSGADGNVSTLEFPGNIKTIYSGIGIYYPDMTPTQKMGVRIDYKVEPTVESIKSGKDIILEKAIELNAYFNR